MIDTKALRAIASAATSGDWRVSLSGYSVKSHDIDTPIVAAVRWLPNADHIAAFSPSPAIALLDELEQARDTAWRITTSSALRDENSKLRAELAAVSAARDEACRILSMRADPCWLDYDAEVDRVAELRAVGRSKGTP